MKITDTIERVLGQIEGKVDGINKRLDIMNGSNKTRDNRINELEHSVDTMKGKTAIIVALSLAFLSGIMTLVINYLN